MGEALRPLRDVPIRHARFAGYKNTLIFSSVYQNYIKVKLVRGSVFYYKIFVISILKF